MKEKNDGQQFHIDRTGTGGAELRTVRQGSLVFAEIELAEPGIDSGRHNAAGATHAQAGYVRAGGASEEQGRDTIQDKTYTEHRQYGIRNEAEKREGDTKEWMTEEVALPSQDQHSRVIAPAAADRQMDWERSFRYLSREQQFVQMARELVWETGEYVEFVPFQTYWPTYEQMTPPQLRWYKYWREEVRAGRYPDTDLSYLFVYLYELIHGFGWSTPVQGAGLIKQAWLGYRERYPKLDGYVREWLYDFAVVFGLELPDLGRLKKLPRTLSLEVHELEWKRRLLAEPVDLTWELLRPLIDYEVEKSKFYSKEGRKELGAYAPKVVALADGYLRKVTGKRLLELYSPPIKKVNRFLFRSAVYDHDMYGRTAVIPVQSISGHIPLRNRLTQLVRLTENRLRELTGVKGKLRGVDVEPDLERLVSRYLEQEFERRRAEKAREQAPKVKLNAAKLRKLQQESDEVRELLLQDDSAEQAGGQDLEVNGKVNDRAGSATRASRSSKTGAAAKNTVQQAEFDFEHGWTLAGHEAAQDEKAIGGNTEEYQEAEVSPVSDGAVESMSDLVGQRQAADPVELMDGFGIPDPWLELLSALAPAHRELLAAMLEGADASRQFAIAEQAGSMPELLHDEINEQAMEAIGDLLIDDGSVMQEYAEDLYRWLKR